MTSLFGYCSTSHKGRNQIQKWLASTYERAQIDSISPHGWQYPGRGKHLYLLHWKFCCLTEILSVSRKVFAALLRIALGERVWTCATFSRKAENSVVRSSPMRTQLMQISLMLPITLDAIFNKFIVYTKWIDIQLLCFDFFSDFYRALWWYGIHRIQSDDTKVSLKKGGRSRGSTMQMSQ